VNGWTRGFFRDRGRVCSPILVTMRNVGTGMPASFADDAGWEGDGLCGASPMGRMGLEAPVTRRDPR